MTLRLRMDELQMNLRRGLRFNPTNEKEVENAEVIHAYSVDTQFF